LTSGYLLQVLGVIISFVSALLLTITEIKRQKTIEAESGTYFDKNPHLEKALKQRSSLAIFSTILLAIGFGLQLVGLGIS
jgi:hypothetical protein